MKLSIGELSRRTGASVKTLRFYSDKALLPEAGRSRAGYRRYAETDVARVDLIRTLRDAGVGLEAIGKVLRQDLALAEVLRLRLGAVEAHVASLQRIASALRAAIQSGASEQALRRISMVTQLSNEERRNVVEGFYAKVMAGHPQGNAFMRGMVEASTPDLPANATAEQLDAWVELATLLGDESFVASMREQATATWSKEVDQAAMHAARASAAKEADAARKRGVAPDSDEARLIAERFLASLGAAGGTPKHDPRADRYWELVGIMKGGHAPSDDYDAWSWLGAALKHHATG